MDKATAIFFDFDGVILESADIKTDAFWDLFAHVPQHQERVKAYHLANMGVSRFKKFAWIYENLLGEPIDDSELARLGERFSQIVFQKVLEAPFVPGAEAMLSWAKANALCFVASGTPQDELRKIVDARGLAPYFDGVYGSPDTKAQIVNNVLGQYPRLAPDQGWFIGDASTDYQAAMETGLRFVARDTPDMADFWREKPVEKVADMHGLENLLRANIV